MSEAEMSALDRIVEERAIERMMYEYSYSLDMNDPATLAALFVEDCEVSYAPRFGAKGMEAYKQTLEGIGSFFKATSHHNSNIVIDFVSPTEANVRSIVLAIHRYQKEQPDGWLFGQYSTRWSRMAASGNSSGASCAPTSRSTTMSGRPIRSAGPDRDHHERCPHTSGT
ncbi:nuclear transport factor 2 family protein [Seohaeicola zhoushanensis]